MEIYFAGIENVGVDGVKYRIVESGYVQGEPVEGLNVTVTLYVPALAALKELTDGFAELEVNPFGPDHEYVALTPEGNEGLKFTDKFAVFPAEIH